MAIIKERSIVASMAMPVDERWVVRRCRYAPDGESKGRVCIATGIHGDEIMGQLIVYGVVRRIMAEPQNLHGIVDVYPMLNPLGLDIGERMVPSTTRLDMNRAFPGRLDGTSLEGMCYKITQDMIGADLVLDIHASTHNKSELYEVRIISKHGERLVPLARTLCPEVIWVYPPKSEYAASLTSALCAAGTPALILEADERHRRPQDIADVVVSGIFCKLHEMGLWSGEVCKAPERDEDIPCIHNPEEIATLTCETPGIYVPEDHIGKWVKAGALLGCVIDAMEGMRREEVIAPCDGLVFSQRSYSAVYPGTLIARLKKGDA